MKTGDDSKTDELTHLGIRVTNWNCIQTKIRSRFNVIFNKFEFLYCASFYSYFRLLKHVLQLWWH